MTPFLSYNNLVFPSNFTSMPRSRFQYDRSGRTVAHTVHTITASYKTVAPLGDGIDAYVLLVRQRLSKAGMPLRYIGSGAGGSCSASASMALRTWFGVRSHKA